MASKSVAVGLQVLLVALVLVVLCVSVGVLVTVLNMHSKEDASSPSPDPSPSPASNSTLPTRPRPTTSASKSTVARTSTKSTSTTTVPKPAYLDDGGVPAAEVIDSSDVRYPAFQEVDARLQALMNTTINPCDDFYNYASSKGNANGLPSSFEQSRRENEMLIMPMYLDNEYFKSASTPMKQLKHYFDKCVTTDATQAEENAVITQKVESLKTQSGVGFPMLYQSEDVETLTPEQLAKLLGFSINEIGQGYILPMEVFQDYEQPDAFPARLYLDPLYYPYSYISNFSRSRSSLIDSTVQNCENIASRLHLPDLDEDQLAADAAAVVDFGYALRDYVRQGTRANFKSLYNLRKLSDLQNSASAFNWIELIKAAMTRANAAHKITDELEVVVMDPDNLNKLSADIAAGKYSASAIANYIHYNTMVDFAQSLPQTVWASANFEKIPLRKRRNHGTSKGYAPTPDPQEKEQRMMQRLATGYTGQQFYCHEEATEKMMEAQERIFIDAAYPTQQEKDDIRKQVTELAKWTLSGFRTQIDMINWMSAESKRGAYNKLDNIALNVVYPEWLAENDKLTLFYKDLNFTTASSPMEVYMALNEFKLTKRFENFGLEQPRDRGDFGSTITATNAYYNPMSNAMIIPGGILNAPFYDANYPNAAQFGILATIIGHEITHGFDDEGIQWDGVGALNDWMDEASQHSFRTMADCVVNEYDDLCPLPPGKPCVNGVQTQGENIADNGGIQVAYKAFKSYEAFNGPDPQLPSFGKVFNNDQLFFLGFASTWNGANSDDYIEYLIDTDPHSPNIDRVFGTLQNFPAFRAAFNCPVGLAYSPKAHCNVWTSPPF